MNSLGECFVYACEHHDHLDLVGRQTGSVGPIEGRALINGVHHHPRQGEQGGARTDDLEVVHAPHRVPLLCHRLSRRADRDLRLEDLVGALVGAAEDQHPASVEIGDHRPVREHHPRRGPRDAGEDQPRRHRDREQADEALRRDDEVGVDVPRRHGAVADGAEGLDAEEKGVEEGAFAEPLHSAAVEPVGQGEQRVEHEERRCGQTEELRPARLQQLMIEVVHTPVAATPHLDPAPSGVDDTGVGRILGGLRFSGVVGHESWDSKKVRSGDLSSARKSPRRKIEIRTNRPQRLRRGGLWDRGSGSNYDDWPLSRLPARRKYRLRAFFVLMASSTGVMDDSSQEDL